MTASAHFTEDFAYEVLSVVEEIPEGTVTTYGQIARLIGKDKNSRLVARVLSHASNYGDFPCHRVVNHSGRLVPGWPEQAFLLQMCIRDSFYPLSNFQVNRQVHLRFSPVCGSSIWKP